MTEFHYYHQPVVQKKVLAIHDISCVGRCSLTVALPILSACGINCGILPTALLSTHTGEFHNYVFHDTSNLLLPIASHLKEAALPFDAIYTGYLANAAQVEQIQEIFSLFPQTLKLIDPAFADHGKLYSMMDMEIVSAFRKLLAHADVVVPNITEALFLLERNPEPKSYSEAEMLEIAQGIGKLGPKQVVITGFHRGELMYSFFYDKQTGAYESIGNVVYEGIFHGTGDSFASALLGCMLNGMQSNTACGLAVEFISRCIEKTLLGGEPLRYGVRFEQVLPWLIDKLQEQHAQN